MKLQNGMLLFHASYIPVEKVDLSLCKTGKDFGRGFYLTSDRSQAKNFINASVKKAQNFGIIPLGQRYGYVSSFRYHESENDIKIFEFDSANKDWLWFIALNRRNRLAANLLPLINQSLYSAEIIIGKIANDTTNPVITTYLSGLYGDVKSESAVNIAINLLMPNRLKDQFCFLSERAINCLEFVDARKYVI
ncbi:MAG: DUF3990 domain-containing protein [Anaerolineaceae bacterium]|nr:DUF3990 domain-containing protein [Anaerolineaceae bacterium]